MYWGLLMATINDITGDPLISKTNTKAYEDNYDRIFGGKKKPKAPQLTEDLEEHPVEWECKENLDW